MEFGLDGRELLGRPTGVGRYLDALLRQWAALEDQPRSFVVFSPAPLALAAAPAATGKSRLAVRVVPGPRGTLWEQAALPRALARHPPDVFFSPAYSTPLATRVPRVVVMHDLSFFAHPEWFGRREGLRRRFLARRAAAAARLVLTDSRFSEGEVRRWLGVGPQRLRVIPLCPAGPLGPTLPRAAPSGPPLVLYVGSIFQRRHPPTLIEAFALVSRAHPDALLEIVGENRTHPRLDLEALLARSGVAARARLRSWVPEETLAELYSRASAFVFLSQYEGFGLPPLEALAAGVPAIVGDTPVAREVCGDAVLYVAPDDAVAVARALEALLSDATLRRRLAERSAAVLARYSWPRTAAATLAALEEAAR